MNYEQEPGSADPDNLLWIANGIQTFEKNYLHPGGAQQREVEPFEGYALSMVILKYE